jgi:hypothetical protein
MIECQTCHQQKELDQYRRIILKTGDYQYLPLCRTCRHGWRDQYQPPEPTTLNDTMAVGAAGAL